MIEEKELHPGLNEKIKMLLTSDGKGRYKKGIALIELAETVNPNWVRESVTKFIKENP